MRIVKSWMVFALALTALCWTGCSKAEKMTAQTETVPMTAQGVQVQPSQPVQPEAAPMTEQEPQVQSPQPEAASMAEQEPQAQPSQMETAPVTAHTPQTQSAVRYKDGTYKAMSDIKDDWGGYGEATVTIMDGKITGCEFLSYEKDGKVKDENYGKMNGVIKNAGLYKIAQTAIKNSAQYGTRLVEMQQLDKVDAIAGATMSHELFQNAAGIALKQAEEAAQ